MNRFPPASDFVQDLAEMAIIFLKGYFLHGVLAKGPFPYSSAAPTAVRESIPIEYPKALAQERLKGSRDEGRDERASEICS